MIDTTLPLTDVHRHLDGNIRAQTILDLGRQYNLTLPAQTLETLIPHVQVTENEPDLVSFLSKLDWGVKVLASLDACRRVAFENIEDAGRGRSGLHGAKCNDAEDVNRSLWGETHGKPPCFCSSLLADSG